MPTGPPRKGHQRATSEVQSSVHCPQSFDAEEFSVFVFLFQLQTTISTELHLIGQKRTACLSSSGKRPTKRYGKWIFPTRKNVAAGEGSKQEAHGACTCTWTLSPNPTHTHLHGKNQGPGTAMARTYPFEKVSSQIIRGKIGISEIMHGLFYTFSFWASQTIGLKSCMLRQVRWDECCLTLHFGWLLHPFHLFSLAITARRA